MIDESVRSTASIVMLLCYLGIYLRIIMSEPFCKSYSNSFPRCCPASWGRGSWPWYCDGLCGIGTFMPPAPGRRYVSARVHRTGVLGILPDGWTVPCLTALRNRRTSSRIIFLISATSSTTSNEKSKGDGQAGSSEASCQMWR